MFMTNKKSHIIMCLAMFCMTVQAQRADLSKMSPFVRHAALTQIKRSQPSRTNGNETHESPECLCAFVRTAGNTDSILTANNCHKLAQFGDISIVNIPLDRLCCLSLSRNVTRIEAGQGTCLHLDSVSTQINATDIHTGTHLPQAYTGEGVVMGIQDIGFDLTHPNFYNSDGTEYRIRRFWDQLSADPSGNRMYVGAEYTDKEDILAYAHSRDGLKETHGTLTLGAAAGSGCGSKYRGIAYGSDICLVSNAVTSDAEFIKPEDQYKYTYATDALGFKYIFDYAAQQGQPCVISFSEGSQQDFRGDDLLYYEVLRDMCGPGRIIVSSAGNTGHVKNRIRKASGRDSAGCFLKLYGNKTLYFTTVADGNFDMRFVTYGTGNDTLTIPTASIVTTKDSTMTVKARLSGKDYTFDIVAYRSCYDNKQTAFDVNISGPKHIGMTTPLSIELIGRDRVIEFYRGNGEMSTDRHNPALCDGDNSYGINSPSSSPYVICVGASSYRTQYVNHLGEHITYDCGSNGERANYSSEGPTYDGRTKPDVLAPGTNIIIPASSYYIENNPDMLESMTGTFCHDNRTYGWLSASGTSMSSPIVGGIIALWLQADPALTPDDVSGILARTCTRYAEMTSVPDNRYGYGQIDAYRGLLDILGVSAIETISKHQPSGLQFSTEDNTLHIIADKPVGGSLEISVFSSNGLLLQRHTANSDNGHYDIDLSGLAKGVYIIQANGHEQTAAGSTLIRI